MRHKQIIADHRAAVAQAKGKQEETGVLIGICIEVKPHRLWQTLIRMNDGSVKPIGTDTPPSSPKFQDVVVKNSGCGCVVM